MTGRPIDFSHNAMSSPSETSNLSPLATAPGSGSWRAQGELLIAFLAGFIFSAGLVMSGLTDPHTVLRFLDVKAMFSGDFPGHWDASLGFIIGGAVLVTLVAFAATPYASVRPWFSRAFVVSRRERIGGRLIVGAIIFGIGWGLSGFCPGPALATVLTGQLDVVIFVMAMLPGMWLARKI